MKLGSKRELGGFAHHDSKHVGPHNEREAVDLQGNQFGDRHNLVHHLVPLLVLHLNREGHQVGTLQATALGQCVGTSALEVECQPIKGHVMGVTRGTAHTLTNRVAFLDTVCHLTLLIRTTGEFLTVDLRDIERRENCLHILKPKKHSK